MDTKPRIVPPEVQVPKLIDKTRNEAEEILKAVHLKVGKVTEEVHEEDTTKPGTVTGQKPEPDTSITIDGAVDITIGTKKEH